LRALGREPRDYFSELRNWNGVRRDLSIFGFASIAARLKSKCGRISCSAGRLLKPSMIPLEMFFLARKTIVKTSCVWDRKRMGSRLRNSGTAYKRRPQLDSRILDLPDPILRFVADLSSRTLSHTIKLRVHTISRIAACMMIATIGRSAESDGSGRLIGSWDLVSYELRLASLLYGSHSVNILLAAFCTKGTGSWRLKRPRCPRCRSAANRESGVQC